MVKFLTSGCAYSSSINDIHCQLMIFMPDVAVHYHIPTHIPESPYRCTVSVDCLLVRASKLADPLPND